MNPIGRNDPCPCGSGKKYKKCCGAKARQSSDLVYDRIRRLDAESGELLVRFAKQRYGNDVLEDAWEDFIFSDEIPFDMSHPEADYFLRWFTFNWKPRGEETLAEFFLSEKESKVGSDVRRIIEAVLRAPYSYLQVLEVDPGAGFTLRDILRKREFGVIEKSASTVLERGYILFARVVELDEIFFIMGNGTRAIPARFLDRLLEMRTILEKESPSTPGSVARETLLAFEISLRESYFEVAEILAKGKTNVRNTDGDPLAMHILTYSIPSFGEAFHALKDLEQKATGRTDEELLAGAEKNDAGELTKVHIDWLGPRRGSGEEGQITRATLTITDSTLVVEVNSEKRSKRIQREINKRLGGDAVLLRTEATSHEGLMKQLAEKKKDAESVKESEHDRLMRESPEVRALIKGLTEKHWASWPVIPLPALKGMTPRQASKDARGRELLESLLMEFEAQNHSQKDEFLRVDLAKLRRDLGLEPRGF